MDKSKGFNALLLKIKRALNKFIKKIKTALYGTDNDPGHDGELFVERKKPRPFALGVLFTTLKMMLATVVVVGCMGMGLLFGIARAYIETTPELDVSSLTKSDRTSNIYDMSGNLITTFADTEYRDWADIEDIPDMLKNAVIAIEDVRFYKHKGVDYKRLFSALINTLRNADTHGGSTLTQQLIKNKVLSKEQSYKRKIKEAYLALEVEQIIKKDDILEAYLNDVYLGDSNYGVKTAAKDYFGKELSELTIRECAMLAGMVQKPYETNPRANTYLRFYDDGSSKMDITNKRTDVVIGAMYNAGFITREQYNSALTDTVSILEKSAQKQLYDMPYFVEYGIRDVVTHLLDKRGMLATDANRATVENELRTGGYSIYLTVDPKIQHTVQDTLATWSKYPKLADPSAAKQIKTNSDGSTMEIIQPQAAAVVFDYHTGELRAVVGGRESPLIRKGLNRAYRSATPVGSSIKPLSVYGPALDLGASPATVIHNFEAPIPGWDSEKGYPAIGNKNDIGPITVRKGLVSSLNVVAARTLLEHVGLEVSASYLENLGVDPSRINVGGSGLALGTIGITPIEMAAAFGAIAAEGEYKEPLSFTRVVDDSGEVILDANEIRKSRQVYKASTAYMLVDMLTDAVNRGTGTKAKIKNMTVAGKTGTNSDYSSVYFAGITPYYTATVWVGHDEFKYKLKKGAAGGEYAAPLWQSFMSKIHEGLMDKPIIDQSPTALGLVRCTTCSLSGKLATDACYLDADGHVPVTDWFEKTSAPTELCDMHILTSVCSESGQPASPYCPNVMAQSSIVVIDPQSPYAVFDHAMLAQYISNAIYSDVPAAEYTEQNFPASSLCSIHNQWWTGQEDDIDSAIIKSQSLLQEVETYLTSAQSLSETDRKTLQNAAYMLNASIEQRSVEEINRYYEQLKYNYDVIYITNPPVVGP
ncbi:MAG: transglycosylase domain-containing protein [Clostridia bacterium]